MGTESLAQLLHIDASTLYRNVRRLGIANEARTAGLTDRRTQIHSALSADDPGRRHIEQHLLPTFGDVPIKSIMVVDVDAWERASRMPATRGRASRPGEAPFTSSSSLDARAAINPYSPVAVLDRLLTDRTTSRQAR